MRSLASLLPKNSRMQQKMTTKPHQIALKKVKSLGPHPGNSSLKLLNETECGRSKVGLLGHYKKTTHTQQTGPR